MNYRQFGKTDLIISEIGCARLGGIFGNLTRPGMIQTLHRAYAEGITLYDTSDMYCQGESEKLLGEAFSSRRDKVVIASKAGYVLPGQRKLVAKVKPLLRPILRRLHLKRENLPKGVRGELSQNFSAQYITGAVEQSLQRLKTDYLDLFQLHSPPPIILEQGEIFETLEKLKLQGKVRYYGVSCERTEDAFICLKYPGLSSLQLRINLLDQSALAEAVPQAADKGLAIIARECFAGGLLAKAPESLKSEAISRDIRKSAALLEKINYYAELAYHNNYSLKQLALNFVLDQPSITTVLLGMNTEQQLNSNLETLPGKV
jgi:aryl-alcohol dehydrogenase-like predicted oxidoreductase